jgi:hypothetical protein
MWYKIVKTNNFKLNLSKAELSQIENVECPVALHQVDGNTFYLQCDDEGAFTGDQEEALGELLKKSQKTMKFTVQVDDYAAETGYWVYEFGPGRFEQVDDYGDEDDDEDDE